jgi:hypothetical protein
MANCDTMVRNATVMDGSGATPKLADLALRGDRILAVGPALRHTATHVIEAEGRVHAPGFIDVHTHDDLAVIRRPAMLPKISQGVTTVIVGNCGISAAPVRLQHNELPDPMNLLGAAEDFRYPTFAAYVAAIHRAPCHRAGHRCHDHRRRQGSANCAPDRLSPPGTACHRCRFRVSHLFPCQRRRILAGKRVLQYERASDHQILVNMRNHYFRYGSSAHDGCFVCSLTRRPSRSATSAR